MAHVVNQAPVDWFETIASAVTDQMAYIDRDGVYRAANRAYIAATASRVGRPDLSVADLVGRRLEEILPPGLVATVLRPCLARCVAGHAVTLQRWFDIGGERRYLSVSYHPHRAGERVLGMVVVIRDRTLERQTQLLLREIGNSVALLSGDVEAVAEELVTVAAERLGAVRAAVWQLELEPPQLRLTRSAFSPRAEGASSDASPGPEIPFPETLSLEELPRFTQFLADGNLIDAHEAQGDARLDELSSRWLEPRRAASVLVVPVMAGGDLCAVLWLESGPEMRVWQASDISFANEAVHLLAHATVHRQRHLLEQRLVDGQKREGLGVLAGGLAHDFNNLLVGILGGADLLDRQMAEHPEVRQRLDLIRNSARRASDLCSQMLAYAGKGRFQSASASLSEITLSTFELVRSTLPNNVDVQLELDPDLPPIEAQVTQIQQVVMNLLLNAAEALEGESGTVVARTELRRLRPNQRLRVGFPGFIGEAPAPGDYVRLLVSDGGCGMDSATVEKIFDPFFTTKLTGRGLGLAAVLGIVRGHQGGISIRSEVGSGSAIEVYFPAMRGAETRGCEAEIRRHQREELAYRQPRVLVVDDEEVVRLIASEMLEFLECEVLLAADGPEALEIFEREGGDLDLVVLDVTMPAMSGEELLIRLRERSAMLPVLVASGFTKEDLSCRFASYDVSGFIHKPYKLDELKDLVDRALLA